MYEWDPLHQIADSDPLRDITPKKVGIESRQDTRFFSEKELGCFLLRLKILALKKRTKYLSNYQFIMAADLSNFVWLKLNV